MLSFPTVLTHFRLWKGEKIERGQETTGKVGRIYQREINSPSPTGVWKCHSVWKLGSCFHRLVLISMCHLDSWLPSRVLGCGEKPACVSLQRWEEEKWRTGPLRSFSHLRSGASQMAAMLMNPTGCCDTTASGRSKWGFVVEQVCVQNRHGVCARVFWE